YGMRDVKDRLVEYLGVRALNPGVKSPILCLVGPPGVGKTSIARSVARALDRSFAQMSLGGVHNEAELRGHRRTYVGALPGRIISGIEQCGAMDPVFLLDEIDKLSRSLNGDPASALLEILDPEQNSRFRDHYIDAPFDLSDVMFITTANTTDTIDRALLDRMEIIEVSSYTLEEKVQIAKRHLVRKQLKAHGLKAAQVRFQETAIRELIDKYTRESGVRTLERQIAKLCRKAALSLSEDDAAKSVTINAKTLANFLGAPKYLRTPLRDMAAVGVVNGLAWTSVGGEVMPVEALAIEGGGAMQLTGKLGEVMRESAKLAHSTVRMQLKHCGLPNDYFKSHDMHVHVPEGAVPKDGPSAGVAITCAMLSAVTGIPARSDIAMTGEITLTGRVLPIGGVKEKLLAAYRMGVSNVLLPRENEKDLEQLDQNVRADLNVEFIERVEEAFVAVLTEPIGRKAERMRVI
ncbi:MAG: endopeptidase La, partial [Christensenellales bacterium]